MFSSLRARLLVWFGTLVFVVILVFGVLIGYAAWRSLVADVDAQLQARANLLVSALEPAGDGTFDLRLPAAALRPDDPLQHAIVTSTGAVIDRSGPEATLTDDAWGGIRTAEGRREIVVRGPSGAVVIVSRSLETVYAEVRSLAVTMAGVGAVAMAVSIIGGWFLVGRALAPIHDALERQRRFTADASHELRTPLTTLATETQWALSRPRTAEEYQHSLDVSRRAAARMQGVVERLLALARAESSAAEPVRERVALDALVAEAVRDLQPLANARGVQIAIDVDIDIDAVPAHVHVDVAAMTDAVTQVVTNAIQYSAEGGAIRIGIRTAADGVTLTVRDDGFGIPADALPRVFEPFFRADPARRRDPGGAGLGLAVARAVVLRHGGRIGCQSDVGAGTMITIELPI